MNNMNKCGFALFKRKKDSGMHIFVQFRVFSARNLKKERKSDAVVPGWPSFRCKRTCMRALNTLGRRKPCHFFKLDRRPLRVLGLGRQKTKGFAKTARQRKTVRKHACPAKCVFFRIHKRKINRYWLASFHNASLLERAFNQKIPRFSPNEQ